MTESFPIVPVDISGNIVHIAVDLDGRIMHMAVNADDAACENSCWRSVYEDVDKVFSDRDKAGAGHVVCSFSSPKPSIGFSFLLKLDRETRVRLSGIPIIPLGDLLSWW